MHQKQHGMELYDLFKRSRGGTRASATATITHPRFEVTETESEEVEMNRLSGQDANKTPESNPAVSYLPKITPIPRKKTTGGLAVRKDTLIVGAVFVGVLVGFSFLLVRQVNVGAAPPTAEAEIVQSPMIHVPTELAVPVKPIPAVIQKAPAEVVPAAPEKPAVKEEETTAPPPAPAPKGEHHVYQLATTGLGDDGKMWAEKYREFLLGNSYDAFTYQTKKGWWTIRVRSKDKTAKDLEDLREFAFQGHRHFSTAIKLPD